MGGAFRRWPRGAPARGFRGGGASLPPRPRALAGAGRRPPRARRGAARLRVRAGGAHAARPSGVAAATGSGLPRRRGLRAPARRRPGDRARAPTPRERDRRGRPSDPRVPRGARARRGRRLEGELRAGRKRVVVIGGGFAGLHLIRRLEHSLRGNAVELTLVDRQNYHLFTPLLYQVATGELPPHAVAYPLRDVTAPARYRFVQSEVEEIDLERRVVRMSEGELAYDHVVIAPGSVTNDYGIPGVREHALSLKTLADGEALKRHVLERFEAADSETDPGRRRPGHPRDGRPTVAHRHEASPAAGNPRAPRHAGVGDRGRGRPYETGSGAPRAHHRVVRRGQGEPARRDARAAEGEGRPPRGRRPVPRRRPRRRAGARRRRVSRGECQAAAAARPGGRPRGAGGGTEPRRARAGTADDAVRLPPQGRPHRARTDAGRSGARRPRRSGDGRPPGLDGLARELPPAAARGAQPRHAADGVAPVLFRGQAGGEHTVNAERAALIGSLGASVQAALATTRALTEAQARLPSDDEGWPLVIVAYHI